MPHAHRFRSVKCPIDMYSYCYRNQTRIYYFWRGDEQWLRMHGLCVHDRLSMEFTSRSLETRTRPISISAVLLNDILLVEIHSHILSPYTF